MKLWNILGYFLEPNLLCVQVNSASYPRRDKNSLMLRSYTIKHFDSQLSEN